MKNYYLLLVLTILLSVSCSSDKKKEKQEKDQKKEQKDQEQAQSVSKPEIVPIQHATFFMRWNQKDIYVDPVGGKDAFERFPKPDIVMITDIHPDHLDVETLAALGTEYKIIAPKAVEEKLPKSHKEITTIMSNGNEKSLYDFSIKAIPMYNTTESRKKFHIEGRGNGYVINHGGFKLYISGDTEITPEMKKLSGINHALLCMNLPYTMDYQQAAKGVLAFKPKKVTPYHYRGKKDGETYFENVEAFKRTIEKKSKDIEVQLMQWYPQAES